MKGNLGRPGQVVQVIQVVDDGWNRPSPRRKDTPDCFSAQKNALIALDFSRVYL